jgi:4-hydroxyphenylpyruvate dioxygenase-like putative hemolysin
VSRAPVVTEVKRALGDLLVRVDHIALAVPDLEASVAVYRDVLGFEVCSELATRGLRSGMRSAVVTLGGVTFVLVQGTEPDSQVSRFVERFGPGVQHIALEVSSLADAASILTERGLRFATPLIDGPFTRQVFTVRDAALAVRIELIERRGEGFSDAPVQRLFLHMEANELI